VAGAGVLVGDAGLTLGRMSFFPRALTATVIEEVFRAGAPLEDMSTGSTPLQVENSELEVVGRGLEIAVAAAAQAVAEQEPRSEMNLVLQVPSPAPALALSPSLSPCRLARSRGPQRAGTECRG